MSGLPSVTFDTHGPVGTQVAHQVIHGSVYNTVTQFPPNDIATPSISNDDTRDDNALLASLAFPEMFDRRSTIESPHPHTCQWILRLDKFKDWQTGSQGLLWVKGNPGSGKSTLMSFIHSVLKKEHQDLPGIYLDFFFSGRGCELQKTPIGMFRSLLNQLFVQNEKARSLLRKAFREKQAAFGSKLAMWNWHQQDLRKLLFDALTGTTEHVPVVIFIDALDEAGEQNAIELARYFHKINDCSMSMSKKVKICLACRHYPFVSRIKAEEIVVENHNNDDIAMFIRDHLNVAALKHDKDWQSWQSLEGQLLKRASGNFQWANITIAGTERSILHGDSPSEVENWLKDVPQELCDCYEQILRTQIDSRYRSQSSLLFALVCYAQERLSVIEISLAISAAQLGSGERQDLAESPPSSEVIHKRIKTWSGGLIEAPYGYVQVIHQSVRDFLSAKGFKVLFELEDSVGQRPISSLKRTELLSASAQCHFMLYRCCLGYLTTIELDSVKVCYRNFPKLRKFRWLHYVILNLFIHAEHVAEVEHKDVKSHVQLLRAVFPMWLVCHQMYVRYSDDHDRHSKELFRFRMRFSYRDYRENRASVTNASTLLHLATTHKLLAVVQYHSDHGIDIDIRDGRGLTPLHIASKQGLTRIAKILARGGADLTAVTARNKTSLELAIESNQTDLVAWLLQDDVCKRLVAKPIPTLQIAAESGNAEIVEMLLELSLPLHTHETMKTNIEDNKDENFESKFFGFGSITPSTTWSDEYRLAIEVASRWGHVSVVQRLLQGLHDVTYVDTYCNRALCVAAARGHSAVVEMLLEAGAYSSVRRRNEADLMVSAAHESRKVALESLRKAGTDSCDHRNIRNAFRKTVASGQCGAVSALAPIIDRLNDRDAIYTDVLFVAVSRQRSKILSTLLETNLSKYDATVLRRAATLAEITRGKRYLNDSEASDEVDHCAEMLKLLAAYDNHVHSHGELSFGLGTP